jgi:hypothetical protein
VVLCAHHRALPLRLAKTNVSDSANFTVVRVQRRKFDDNVAFIGALNDAEDYAFTKH